MANPVNGMLDGGDLTPSRNVDQSKHQAGLVIICLLHRESCQSRINGLNVHCTNAD